jgi:hypothetical protein
MQIDTRSQQVIRAIDAVFARMPIRARTIVEDFIEVIRTRSDYPTFGLTDIDPTSAMLAPLYNGFHFDSYTPQVLVTLPIFQLFSPNAQVGIMAHEFAHAVRACKLGPGWHEKMQTRYAAEERLADLMADRWGFSNERAARVRERRSTVNPWLDLRRSKILRRMLMPAQ